MKTILISLLLTGQIGTQDLYLDSLNTCEFASTPFPRIAVRLLNTPEGERGKKWHRLFRQYGLKYYPRKTVKKFEILCGQYGVL